MIPTRPGLARVIRPALVAGVALGLGLASLPGPAAARSSHPGSGYGLQGGVNPELALGNVFSGIYGARYTYDRAHYDFRGCPNPMEAAYGYTPTCPPPFLR